MASTDYELVIPDTFVFPGQGGQKIGMFRGQYEINPVVREMYDRADEVTLRRLGRKVSEVSFYGPQDTLDQTIWIQPSVFVASSAAHEVLKRRGIKPKKVAGHSVGEFAALNAAGVLDFENNLEVVIERGLAMDEVGHEASGGMAALLGMSQRKARDVARIFETQVANINSPKQVVISGIKDNIDAAVSYVKGLEIRGIDASVLNIPLAAHSRLMKKARQRMNKDVLPYFDFKKPNVDIAFYSNQAQRLTDPELIRQHLAAQLTKSVLWYKGVSLMIQEGAKNVVEVGYGTTLTKLLRRDFRNLVHIIPVEQYLSSET
ncbi:acyltransferase domain-containing protein [Candidatus Saccharibacteria bacterium]|nr:acyltransferase domain-containing protein [Candidatus Saccharibacteria bacterium]